MRDGRIVTHDNTPSPLGERAGGEGIGAAGQGLGKGHLSLAIALLR
jgi:hypothetical protein